MALKTEEQLLIHLVKIFTMKKIFILSFCFLIIVNLFAQKKTNLAHEAKQILEGHWTGVINNDTITIVLLQTRTKAEDIYPTDSIVFLYGWHKISDSLKIIESSLDSISIDLSKSYTILASYKSKQKKIQLSIHDLTRDRWLSGELILSTKKNAILTTMLKEVWRNEDKTYLDGQTFPKIISLKRISKKVSSTSK